MPAAAVIPAPIADFDSAAVKKLVVGFWSLVLLEPFRALLGSVYQRVRDFRLRSVAVVNSAVSGWGPFTVRKSRCSKRVLCSKASARNDKIRHGRSCWFFDYVMVKRNNWGYLY